MANVGAIGAKPSQLISRQPQLAGAKLLHTIFSIDRERDLRRCPFRVSHSAQASSEATMRRLHGDFCMSTMSLPSTVNSTSY
ncbi:hypothetical protein AB1N83_008947 [Pleurotus pulmonarius]